MFLGESGSMAGGQTTGSGTWSPDGMYWAMWNTVMSYPAIMGRRKSRTSWFGVERSMWHRQIHLAWSWAAMARIPAGWASWTMM
jgi:hypothetical protein